MTKLVRIDKDVHEKLSELKQKNNAKSINDVIKSLIEISEEFYTNQGTLNIANKQILLKNDNGKIVEIEIRSNSQINTS